MFWDKINDVNSIYNKDWMKLIYFIKKGKSIRNLKNNSEFGILCLRVKNNGKLG